MSRTASAAPPRLVPDARAPGAPATAAVCSHGPIRCHAHVLITAAGEIAAAAAPLAAPPGLGPAQIQSAYQIDPSQAKPATVAIVDAFGYADLESDLAVYRAQFGLPPCTRASGCLTILNQSGATSPLPPESPPDDDWPEETALDVDAISAACPSCKIIVVQANDTTPINMFTGNNTAAGLHPTVISDSWGVPTAMGVDVSPGEPFFDHPGIAQFVASGDKGYDEGGMGPTYPSTSAHTISVGGTSLVQAANARGWSETAWAKGGSSCSYTIPRPAYQTSTECQFRAASDIAAVGDPATGLAVYNARAGGWVVVGGTSAASPLVAALFASIGRGDITAAQIAQSTRALFDVTSGSNGTCGTLLCNATTGWDGPTGFGTPSAALLSGAAAPGGLDVAITSPADGDSVDPGFQVMATASASAAVVGLFIDGNLLRTATAPPYVFSTSTNLSFGVHDVQVVAQDAQNNQVVSAIRVKVRFGGTAGPPPDPETGNGGGCRAGGDPAPGALLALIAAVVVPLRRRR
ncbi:MAG TPA: Ig-like domain-containing protein [Kofleriaceae bacterium]|nr:Ig-like domain-containing protein [Kofleriaceae bacterium]